MVKSSEDWSKHIGTVVIDPDGWDRSNFNYSWFEELISKEEFMDRVINSTCLLRGCNGD